MKKDILLSGVGGQGILSVATVIGDAAVRSGLFLKQAEVHGMSQRGGEVESGLRLSDTEIHSDLLSLGSADLILSLEPMEALRYLPFLKKDGWIITSSVPFRNIPDYPEEAVMSELAALPNVVALDLDALTKEISAPKSANIILLGAASNYMEILSQEQLKESVARIFASKGEKTVGMNIQAFETGMQYGKRQ